MFLIAGVIVVLDQIIKAIVVHSMQMGSSINILGSVVRLTRTQNSGAAFGLFKDGRVAFIIVSAVASLAIILLRREIAKMRSREQMSFGLILGGAVGNLVDRVRVGAVVDFLDIGVGSARWPAFNVADSAITIGVSILAFYLIFRADSHWSADEETHCAGRSG
jgi:signal peptidase II